MTGNSDLYELIKELSKSEKAYFKKYVYKGKAKTDVYINLFNDIEKGVSKSNYLIAILDKKLREKYAGKTSFSSLKNYLYNLTLKSLIDYRKTNERDQEVMDMYRKGLVLEELNLHQQAIKLLGRALKKAKDLYLSEAQSLIYKALINIAGRIEQFEESSKLHKYKLEYIEFNKVREQEDFINLQNIILEQKIRQFGAVRNEEHKHEIEKIVKNPKIAEDQLLSLKAKKYFYQIKMNYYIFTYEARFHLYYQMRYLRLLEQNSGLDSDSIATKIASYFKITQQCLRINRLSLAQKYFRKFKALKPVRNKDITDYEQCHLYLTVLETYLSFKFDKAVELIPLVESKFEEFNGFPKKALNLSLSYFLTMSCIFEEKYDQAIKWINYFLDNEPKSFLPEYKSAMRIINLVIHTELQNFALMPYLLRNTYRYFIDKVDLLETEKEIIDLLRKRSKMIDKRDIEKLYLEKIEVFKELKHIHEERLFYMFFDIELWLQSKIENKPFKLVTEEINKILFEKSLKERREAYKSKTAKKELV